MTDPTGDIAWGTDLGNLGLGAEAFAKGFAQEAKQAAKALPKEADSLAKQAKGWAVAGNLISIATLAYDVPDEYYQCLKNDASSQCDQAQNETIKDSIGAWGPAGVIMSIPGVGDGVSGGIKDAYLRLVYYVYDQVHSGGGSTEAYLVNEGGSYQMVGFVSK